MKTKNNENFVKKKINQCGFVDMLVVNPQGLAGGLVLAWTDYMSVSIVKYSSRFVHVSIMDQNSNVMFSAIFFYASCVDAECNDQFNFILEYSRVLNDTFILIGDFNCILHSWKRRVEGELIFRRLLFFPSFVNTLRVLDLSFKGPIFTWNNNRDDCFNIQERLDGSLASFLWCQFYPNAYVEHLEDIGSDHRPQLVCSSPPMAKAKKYYFDSRWCSNPTILVLVRNAWFQSFSGSVMFNSYVKIKACRKFIVDWHMNDTTNSKV